MFDSAIKAAPFKRSLCVTLSALFSLTFMQPAIAESESVHIANSTSMAEYCRDDSQTQVHSYRYQSEQQRLLNCMVTQLKPYQQKDKTSAQQYFAYKAQAWLNYAIHQDSMNSRSSAGQVALEMAEPILQALDNDTVQALSLYQDIPSTSALMRPDLWATVNALKDSDGIKSAPREMAFSEVALIWAATNQCARGWRESGMHFRMADRWLEQAREAYVNTNDSQTNVALEKSIASYYKQYAPLDASDDICRGQDLTSNR
ncbi:MAG: hypothetical protein ACTH6Z_05240 [Psychrobacter sp.]